MKNSLRYNTGFTLIELLVVIAIIGLLSSVVLASLNTAREKSRDARRLADIRQLQIALEFYYDENGAYPTSLNCGATTPNGAWCNSIETMSGGHWIHDNGSGDLSSFLATDPVDPTQGTSVSWFPIGGGTIFYFAANYPSPAGTGQWYMIVFGLEDFSHPMQNTDGVTACDGITYFDYGTGSNGVITVGGGCTY